MSRGVVALLSALVVGLMMVPGNVVAGNNLYLEVEDRVGDVAVAYDYDEYDYLTLLGENSPLVKVGYFDMTLFWFGLKGCTYTFGMELAADLPEEGDPLPQGVQLLQYTVWLDKDWWDWASVVESYFIVVLQYDGMSYSAALLEYPSRAVIMQLPFVIDGPRFEVKFSADSIDNVESFWLVAAVVGYFGENLLKLWPDLLDLDAAPGQVYTSIEWPPVTE